MAKKPIVILPLAAALAALGGTTAATATTSEQAEHNIPQSHVDTAVMAEPNVLFKAGDDLLGLIVSRQADGTVLAQHYSHSSHASHASHSSHFSSRY